ncbi:MAG: type I restriction endonuclease subunit R [Candidatus Aminicenantes bacterium]|nr:MAG: type I restriction endonuclease subunit R [Candidatus Aminicenantes bacterium]
MPNIISENDIEKAIISMLTEKLGFRHINFYNTDPNNANDGTGRKNNSDVVFFDILREKAGTLNPDIPPPVIDEALTILTNPRYAMSPITANKEVYQLIRDGIPVEYQGKKGKTKKVRVKMIDFNHTDKNDFLAISQLWIKGERYFRRPDIILYINGLPIVFIELKNSNIKLKNAYDHNLNRYKKDIPQLFLYNAVCILSNAIETKVGSFTAGWENFFCWLRPEDEKEKIDRKKIEEQGTSIERAILGLCTKNKLLDYLENFILYHKDTTKLIAQNHQFIGVNKAVASFKERDKKEGKLGVFWHTQGSGKSFSMIFFSRKIFRKFNGDFTFVVITDRDDLDGQIYRNFLFTETVKKNEASRPKNSAEMRKFLSYNKRLVFTLIQKFRWDKGKDYPLLTDRKDVIVMVDEAHRTQYRTFAENMRKGLPNAQYIAFTGTPLLGKERKTNAWFGDYVSEYNFTQSVDDGATVPLYYKRRVPEVLIQNENLNDEFYQILEDENLDETQQAKLEKEYANEIEVIKRDDRLETIARDIVYHFTRRGYLGKGMVISVDKFTSVKMYDKVQKYWEKEKRNLVGQIRDAFNDDRKQEYQQILDYMRSTEMAVVISEEAGEEEKFDAQGLNIRLHRQKINAVDENGHDIEYRFKDPCDPLGLVFICAMWLCGFDAPTVSSLYLDKPMKDHGLMQAIARANRVTSHKINDITKKNGEIVDYYNVFRNMEQALAQYALGSDDGKKDMPVQEKSALFALLDNALDQGHDFCKNLGIHLEKILRTGETFKKIELFNQYANILLEKDIWRNEFIVYENTITSLYEACKPEILKDRSRPLVFVFQYLRGILDSHIHRQDIETARQKISNLLDQSVITSGKANYIKGPYHEYQDIKEEKTWDLSKLNFENLKEKFKEKKYKNIEIADLRKFIADKLEKMIRRNATRTNFAQRFQEIIDNYNAGGSTNENYYYDLLKFAEDLRKEEERHIREGLSEDELELFDILKSEKMTKAEEKKIKLAAKALLHRLLSGRPRVFIQDWYKDTQSQAKVKTAVEEVLDKKLPESYQKDLFKAKCHNVFNLIYKYASEGLKWAA